MNKFDQHIKDKLSQPHLPPTDSWKNIQEKLDEKEKKKRIIPLFYWLTSTAACLVAGISIYYFNQKDSVNVNHFQKNEIVKKKSTANESIKKEWNKIEKTNEESSDKKMDYSLENSIQVNPKTAENSSSYFEKTNEESTLFSNIIINKKEELTEINSNQKENFNQNNHSFNQKNEGTNKKLNSNLLEEKPLELVIEEEKKENNKSEKVEVKQKSPILVVSSYINPTKMLNSKSILADEFNDLNVKNNLTVAYGAKVSVRVNDKINLRSGISKVELEQNTTNINTGINTGYYALPASTPKTSSNITYYSNIRVLSSETNHNAMLTIFDSQANKMEQKVHYIEIPVEVEYKLASFDKFNLLATAGGSYYMVTKNAITLTDVNTRNQYTLGKANNLNNMSYSANAGVKLEYNLSNKSSLNLEPNYRYMLNPLKNVEAKNPSLLGLNLGFSIKF
ncbi:outer membrane beta-barrel protein [Empedobacter brevis]|uniref:outer membrane beta-barrel protein n=1 Tax=Empedobacter brevis TaxID=247 RepID=UPI0039B0BA6F